MKKNFNNSVQKGEITGGLGAQKGELHPLQRKLSSNPPYRAIIQWEVLSTYIIVPHLKDSTSEKLGMYALSLVESFKNLTIYSTSVVFFLAYSGEYATLALTTS